MCLWEGSNLQPLSSEPNALSIKLQRLNARLRPPLARLRRGESGGYRIRTCASLTGEWFSKPSLWTTQPTLLGVLGETRTPNRPPNLCGHPESNWDQWFRKPSLYPLSYDRKFWRMLYPPRSTGSIKLQGLSLYFTST